MEVIPMVKRLFQNMPEPIGELWARVPYEYRPCLGKNYREMKREINAFEEMPTNKKKQIIFTRFRKSLKEAMEIPFYRDLYKRNDIRPEDIRCFEDIKNLPVITKEMLKECPLENRSGPSKGRYMANTGGSSGSTLSFYITPEHIPVEWAHMHAIWGRLGYKPSDLKISFSGRNLGADGIRYDGLRHQYSINIYKNIESYVEDLRAVVTRKKIRFLHGYPSAIAEFGQRCKEIAPDVISMLKTHLKGALLGSEYPAEIYRSPIEEIFEIPTVSWYGHTERAILAWEKNNKFEYEPFQTYGYCEVLPDSETGGWRLIGTTYFNAASPFIRYDTGDDVEPIEIEEGLLKKFAIRKGRLGDFVLDRKGTRISLTALIFGRHHRLFNIARFIQVKQREKGEMTVLATISEELPKGFVFFEWFDATGLDMEIRFEIIDEPIRSPSGKVVLKVNE